MRSKISTANDYSHLVSKQTYNPQETCLDYSLRPFAGNLKALQIVTVSLPSFLSLFFKTLQYVLASRLSVKASITSTTEKYHFPSLSLQTILICLPLKILFSSFIVLMHYVHGKNKASVNTQTLKKEKYFR